MASPLSPFGVNTPPLQVDRSSHWGDLQSESEESESESEAEEAAAEPVEAVPGD